jgi:putative sterol carrier protein
MSSSLSEGFFEELALRDYEPLLEKASGTVRFEVVDGGKTKRWLVTIDKGRIGVSRKNERAGTTVRLETSSFARALEGKLNLMAAVLRGEIVIQGDPRLLVRLQRLLPSPGGTGSSAK